MRVVESVIYPLTAPVSPPTMRRSASTKKASAGTIDSAVNARIRAVSCEYCDWNVADAERQREVRRVAEHSSGSR